MKFDLYTLHARILPGLIVIIPVALALICWAPAETVKLVGGIGVIFAVGIGALLAPIVRDRGRSIQPDLFHQWGGKPATILLRHRDDTISPGTKARYHRTLASHLADSWFPTADEERDNPTRADETYHDAVEFLKSRTRQGSPLVLAENTNYGFRRNTLGLRKVGLVTAGTGVTISAAHLGFHYDDNVVLTVISLGVCALVLFLWWKSVSPDWVKITAVEYGRQLLATLDSLPGADEKQG